MNATIRPTSRGPILPPGRTLRAAALALSVLSVSSVAGAQEATQTFGTRESFLRFPATEFLPLNPIDGPYTTTGSFGNSGQITRYGSGDSFLVAPVHLPSGALLTVLQFGYCDLNAGSNRSYLQLVGMDRVGNVQLATPALDSIYGSCDSTFVDLTGSNIVIDNGNYSYHLVFYNNIGDGSESIGGARIGYKLQVSPPPDFPHFGDVPPNNPFFQFVEALYQAGITGGCGGGNFCPDTPVTRGQMAVFLSKALGLAFQ